MIPLGDDIRPARRPVMTYLLLAVTWGVWLLIQQGGFNPQALAATVCNLGMVPGEITHRVESEMPCFACALGGPEGRHLFLLCNEFEGVDQLRAVLARRSARIYVTEVPS